MGNTFDDKEYEQALEEHRYKELKASLRDILATLNKPNYSAVLEALASQTRTFEGFVSAIKSLPAPQVNVQSDSEELELSVSSMSSSIISELRQLRTALEAAEEREPKQWVFTVKRNANDLIQTITATRTI